MKRWLSVLGIAGMMALLALAGTGWVLAGGPKADPGQPRASAGGDPRLRSLTIRPAQIQWVRVLVTETQPPQVTLLIRGGLADGCTRFDRITTNRYGNQVVVRVTTQRPQALFCTQAYGFFEQRVELGSDFRSGVTYTVRVNNLVQTFTLSSASSGGNGTRYPISTQS